MGRLKSVIFNDTPFEFTIVMPTGGICLTESKVNITTCAKHTISIDRNTTFREYWLESEHKRIIISSDDLTEFKEIRVTYDQSAGNVLSLVTTPRDLSDERVDSALKALNNEVSPKLNAASRSCSDLKELLIGVQICQKQCNHLVQTCVKRVEKVTGLYSQAVNGTWTIRRLYNAGRLKKLYNHFDRLVYVFCDAKDLLPGLSKGFGKGCTGCFYADATPEGYGKSTKLEWSSTVHRYALKWSKDVELAQVTKSKPDTSDDVSRLARADRKDLQLGLERGLICIPDTSDTIGRFARLCFKPNHKRILQNLIIKRCKVEMLWEQNPQSMDSRSLSVDLECFRIDHLDLKPNRLLGEGSFKHTYEGEWCGQRVSIATLTDFELEDLQNEVKQLLGLQHPKVVSFFGWAYTDDAPAPIKKHEDVGKCRRGYIVTERMECDLEYLINITQKSTTIRKDSGGPFSLSVGLDILLRIVEAMLHVQKHSVMHRDLKPGNFLVNSKSSPRSGTDKHYDVKLIDFGSSKLLGEDKNTYNRGTSRYGAPEMMVGKDRGGEEKGRGCVQLCNDLLPSPYWNRTLSEIF